MAIDPADTWMKSASQNKVPTIGANSDRVAPAMYSTLIYSLETMMKKFLYSLLMLTASVPALAVSFEETKAAAEQGDAKAQNILCRMYYNGDGVEENYGEAVKWCRRSADQGFVPAQYNLGFVYARRNLGEEGNNAEAAKWYRKAAEEGSADAQVSLGRLYEKGDGVKKNSGEAVKWYRKAAEAGLPEAQVDLGHMYERGEGVKKNKAEAAKWYRKAADQHLMDGELALSEMNSKEGLQNLSSPLLDACKLLIRMKRNLRK